MFREADGLNPRNFFAELKRRYVYNVASTSARRYSSLERKSAAFARVCNVALSAAGSDIVTSLIRQRFDQRRFLRKKELQYIDNRVSRFVVAVTLKIATRLRRARPLAEQLRVDRRPEHLPSRFHDGLAADDADLSIAGFLLIVI